MTLKTLDQILINSEKEIRMSQFKHKPNTGSLFYQEDNTGSPKPNWKGKIVIDDDVLKMLIDDRKTNEEPPILNLAGWMDHYYSTQQFQQLQQQHRHYQLTTTDREYCVSEKRASSRRATESEVEHL